MRVLGVIPARYGSTRLEGKPLADIMGKPMIQYVYENAAKSSILDELIVATDNIRIKEAVEKFGGKAMLTSPSHPTGTDRVAEVAKNFDPQVVVNIQGDEPFINPGMIDEVVEPLLEDKEIPMGTLMHEITEKEDFNNPNVVKVVTDKLGFALYFSRSLIPYPRKTEKHRVFEHIGIYSFQKEFLLKFTRLEPTPLEQTESLEQLRVLESGYRIKVVLTRYKYVALSVDTPEDLERARIFAKSMRKN
ncbi:3-deoxy-manno-octulosonate cytidylyltransferase [Candidatus Aerophobetes bacterium]|uniref:3-deoxy-manno-octulosonate cytidylyltransferase n=1 Tax=Aerophobetes bacterium TaxID=2030807 RepID=A0A7V0N0L1_UNCAE|nr:3-deoxy-manno-octulosonate cytidylyltransferase [Candidatus Aerophobetes bacterium]HDN84551.1 3-deoxy-manno-octulosonate cytidylyltransferase [Candidatus Aerophobetes bacterium]